MAVDLFRARRAVPRRGLPRRVSSDFYPFGGGLNLIDSPLSSKPGQLQNALNYEIGFEGGYRRIGGYKQTDGRPPAGEDDYRLLPVALTQKPVNEADVFSQKLLWPRQQNLVLGLDNGGMAVVADYDQRGGYGQNVLLNNTTFEDSWDLAAGGGTLNADNSPQFGYQWTSRSATIPTMTRIDVASGSSTTFQMQALSDPIAVAVGDMLYVSVLVRGLIESGTDFTWDGIRLQIDNATGDPFGLPSSTPFVDFDLKGNTINGKTAHFDAAGVENLADNVKRLWARTKQCSTADAAMTLTITMLEQSSPGTFTTTISDTSKVSFFGGAMAVVWEAETSPHNNKNGRDLSNTALWARTSLTSVVDGATAWASGVYPDFTRVTEDTSSGVHQLASGVLNVAEFDNVMVAKGDRVYIEFYAQHTVGQVDGVVVQVGNDYRAGFDLLNGVIADVDGLTPLRIDEHAIEDLGSNRYKCTVTFTAFTQSLSEQVFIRLAEVPSQGDTDTSYLGSSRYLDITGVRVVVMPTGGDEVQLVESVTTDAPKNVATGHLVVAGSTQGPQFSEGETIAIVSRQIDTTQTPDLVFENRREVGIATGRSIRNGETNATLDTQYRASVEAIASPGPTDVVPNQSSIGVPTPLTPFGSGPTRGIQFHNGFVLAFRDSADGAQGQMWKSSGVGWRRVDRDVYAVEFDAGSGSQPALGATLTISGDDYWLVHLDTASGSWGTDAAGTMYVKKQDATSTNNMANNANIDVGVSTVALVNGLVTVPDDMLTLAPGGRYEFREGNFFGAQDRRRLYWVSGEDKAYEYWDKYEAFIPIATGMVDDRPTHLAIHNYMLFLSFRGGSVQNSAPGDPHDWSVVTGAAEIAVGDDVTGFVEEIVNSLFIYTRNRSWILAGTSRADFDLQDFNVNAGAHEWSLQRIGMGTYFDDRGFTSIRQMSRGNSIDYQEDTQSELIQPLVESLVKNAEVVASHLIRNRNIYRCYFNDGRVISIGFENHSVAGHMPLEYPFVPVVITSEEEPGGAERIFAGDADGKIYELETGTSFDGEPIESFMRTVLYSSKSPGAFKRYSHCRLDGTFKGALTLMGRIEFDYDDPELNLGEELDFSDDSAGGYWDDMEWDDFIWDKTKSGNPQRKVEGEGTNLSVYLHSESVVDRPHTLRGITMQWTRRRDDRRGT